MDGGPPVDAIILTHAHIDHCGYLGYVREDVPVHCTRASELIMRCFDETGKGHQLTEVRTKFAHSAGANPRPTPTGRRQWGHVSETLAVERLLAVAFMPDFGSGTAPFFAEPSMDPLRM